MEERSGFMVERMLIMKHFESKSVTLSRPADVIYDKFSDFNNFRGLIPDDRIEKFECTETSCTISAKGIPDFTLDIMEKIPWRRIVYNTHGQKPLDIRFGFDIKSLDVNSTEIRIFIDADVNGLTGTMLSRPFQNLIDMMADNLEKIK